MTLLAACSSAEEQNSVLYSRSDVRTPETAPKYIEQPTAVDTSQVVSLANESVRSAGPSIGIGRGGGIGSGYGRGGTTAHRDTAAAAPVYTSSPGTLDESNVPVPSSSPNILRPVDEVLKQLPWGNIAFNTPTSMKLGETKTIQLLLSASVTGQELANQLTEPGVATETAQIHISSNMEAQLSGSSFKISAILPERQAIGSTGTEEWKWEVTPTATGRHKLHLVISTDVDVEGSHSSYVIQVYDRDIVVNVSGGQVVLDFVKGNWQWLWTVLVVPLAGWGWKRSRASAQATRQVSRRRKTG